MRGGGGAGRGDGIVYSSRHGRMCPRCSRPVSECACEEESAPPAATGPVTVRRETKGRRGKAVTVVENLALSSSELRGLARALRAECGAGGTTKGRAVEVQGDHREAVARALRDRGMDVRVL